MRYSTQRPHLTLHLPRVRTYLLRHGDTHRWYVCRDCLHCMPLADLFTRTRHFIAWWHDGLVR